MQWYYRRQKLQKMILISKPEYHVCFKETFLWYSLMNINVFVWLIITLRKYVTLLKRLENWKVKRLKYTWFAHEPCTIHLTKNTYINILYKENIIGTHWCDARKNKKKTKYTYSLPCSPDEVAKFYKWLALINANDKHGVSRWK